jgi:hypothetical protein
MISAKRVEGTMNKLGVAVMVVFALVGVALALTTLYDQPSKPSAGVRIDLSTMTLSAKYLPVAHYDHDTGVFN